MSRFRTRLRGASAALALGCVATGAPLRAADGPGSLSGIWSSSTYRHSSVFDPREAALKAADGALPPLLPQSAALLERRIKDSEAGRPFINTKTLCLPSGIPQLLFGPAAPIQILETPTEVIFLAEEFRYYRIIRLNARHQPGPADLLLGDSIGHWEGDTLVVDTDRLSDRTVLDVPGMPHSDRLHVIERLRRAGPDRIEVAVTIDDPKTFSRTWTANAAFRRVREPKLLEFVCENQHDAPPGSAVGDAPR